MINVQSFLLENTKDKTEFNLGVYTLVTYNGRTEATYFSKHFFDDEPWFLESPCELYKICKVDKSLKELLGSYLEEYLEIDTDSDPERFIDDFIKEYIEPMIIDGYFYDIENFQFEPYLPKEVDNIKIISERECLEWLINNYTE